MISTLIKLWYDGIMHRADPISLSNVLERKPLLHKIGLHTWEYKDSCNGASHSFWRECACGIKESLGSRRCGISCSTFRDFINNLPTKEKRQATKHAKEQRERQIRRTRNRAELLRGLSL